MMRKAQAAKYLGIGTSTLERYMAQHRLPYRYEPGQRGNIVVFDERDLETFRAERARETATGKTKAAPSAPGEKGSISFRLEQHYWKKLEALGRQRGLSVHEAARWLVMMSLDNLQGDVIQGHFIELTDRLEELRIGLGRALATLMVNLPEGREEDRPRAAGEAREVIERAMGVSLT